MAPIAEPDRRCTATCADGSQCRNPPRSGRTECFQHDGASAEERREARSAGGKAGGKVIAVLPEDAPDLELRTVDNVCDALAKVANWVSKGKLDVKVGNSMAYLLSTLIGGLQKADLEARLEAVEEALRAGTTQKPAKRNLL
jgi:hypothetical protein